jgi:phosphate transport system permease protein
MLAGKSTGAAADRIFRGLVILCALAIIAVVVLIVHELWTQSALARHEFGWKFFTSSDWDPVSGLFGAMPFIYGTLVSSLLALLMAVPLGIGVAVYMTEICPRALRSTLSFFVELLAAIPSVVYGLWGIFVLLPLLRQHVMPFLRDIPGVGSLPLFSGPAYGPSMLAAGLILAIMVLPYISSVSREVLLAVPRSQREAALALGATRWEMIWGAVLPYAKSGIVGGVILGLGRALGETMAVTMLIGNRHEISASLFAPGYTMASLIANEFSEASKDIHLAALMAVGFTLFVITIIVNAIARWLVWQVSRRSSVKAS